MISVMGDYFTDLRDVGVSTVHAIVVIIEANVLLWFSSRNHKFM